MRFTRAQAIIFAGAALVLLFFVLVFAGLIPGLRGRGERAATLEFWGVFDGPEAYQEQIEAFKKLHPTFKINYTQKSEDTYEQELIDALASRRGPDIFMIGNTWLLKHGAKLVPLPQDLLDPRTFEETFVDVVRSDFVYQGRVWALPLSVETMALLWNKDLFARAGLALPPRTWEEFVNIVPRIKSVDGLGRIQRSAASIGGSSRNINRASDLLSLLMMQSGSRMSDPTTGKADLSFSGERAAARALAFYTQFADARSPLYTWSDEFHYSLDAFPQGTLAMLFTYNFRIPTIRAKNAFLNFGVAPMPQFAAAERPIAYANYWAPAVSIQSPNWREAWEFIVFLASRDQARTYLQKTQKPPARRDLIPEFQRDPALGVFAEQALRAVSWRQPDPIAVERIFDEMVDNVNFGRMSAQEAVGRAEAAINLLVR